MKKQKPLFHYHFTLVELLVVITVISVLISLLVPSLTKTIYKAKNAACLSTMKNLAVGTFMYCDDYDGLYPQRTPGGSTARFGMRLDSGDSDSRLSHTLKSYTELSGWVCPLYEFTPHENIKWDENGAHRNGTLGQCSDGGRRGCQSHGYIHASKLRSDWRRFERSDSGTYGFLGGLKEWTSGYAPNQKLFALGDRLRLGDAYIMDLRNHHGSNIVETSLLWAHSGHALGVPMSQWGGPNVHNKFTTTHAPPPGTEYTVGDEVYISKGFVRENYCFDDGSVTTGEFFFSGYHGNSGTVVVDPFIKRSATNVWYLFPSNK